MFSQKCNVALEVGTLCVSLNETVTYSLISV
jgi:hypothetical protein